MNGNGGGSVAANSLNNNKVSTISSQLEWDFILH